jgi:hypothetical protein
MSLLRSILIQGRNPGVIIDDDAFNLKSGPLINLLSALVGNETP